MAVFDYDESFQQAEYYELLNVLMERWETEIVEHRILSLLAEKMA